MSTGRKSLHPLQPAAGDKENLVGPGRTNHSGRNNLKSLRKAIEKSQVSILPAEVVLSKKRKKVSSKLSKATQVGTSKPSTTGADLISTGRSCENYWECLAKQQRIALDEALAENERLVDKLKHLKEKNRICKELLKEQESLVDVLKDMLNDPAEESTNLNDSL